MKNAGSTTILTMPLAAYNRREREHLAALAAGGTTPAPRQPRPEQEPTMRKQTGRRYGAPPRKEPVGPARPMGNARRAAVYGITPILDLGDGMTVGTHADNPYAVASGGTARQRRQWNRMHGRSTGRVSA